MFKLEGLEEYMKYDCLTISDRSLFHQWGSNHGFHNNGESGPLCFYHSSLNG